MSARHIIGGIVGATVAATMLTGCSSTSTSPTSPTRIVTVNSPETCAHSKAIFEHVASKEVTEAIVTSMAQGITSCAGIPSTPKPTPVPPKPVLPVIPAGAPQYCTGLLNLMTTPATAEGIPVAAQRARQTVTMAKDGGDTAVAAGLAPTAAYITAISHDMAGDPTKIAAAKALQIKAQAAFTQIIPNIKKQCHFDPATGASTD